MSSRKVGEYRAVFVSEAVGLVVLMAAGFLLREPPPPWPSLLTAFTGGVIGALALMLLFRSMVSGTLSTAAPISGLLTAAVPILVGALRDGLPGWLKLVGFALALAAVWLFAQAESSPRAHPGRRPDLVLPLLAGLGFGLYFVLLHQDGVSSLLWTLFVARFGGALVLALALLLRREPLGMGRGVLGVLVFSALMDLSANWFYLLAGRAGRMDIAAVLSSLYPGGTVLLAWWLLKERISARQSAGILVTLAAVVLLTI